ncbi:endonuclease/exonuclease/phosphatase family protein [Candidatus Bipolaricaulota bacterium]
MRTEMQLIGVLVIGLLLVVGLAIPVGRVIGSGDFDDGLTVVSLNACWLFDGEGEGDFYTAPQSAEDAEEHLIDVASYLSTVNADFIVIEEIESADMLHRLNNKLGGGYNEIFVQGTDDYTGQDVAGLSRFPVLAMGRSDETQGYPIFASRFRAPMGTEDVAKHFWATTEIGDEIITFIGLHLLAYPDDLERVVRREAQALIIQNLAKSFLDSGHEVVIVGDVNDFDSVVCDAAENEPRSCVDRLFSDIDPDTDGDEMINAAGSIPQADRYTYWYDENRNGVDDGPEEHSMIDHMYVSRDLAEHIVDVRIDHSGYEARTVSDHWPIIVTFGLP